MISFLQVLSWIALLGELLVGVFSLAAGLYYLAELIEEYSVIAKKAISGLTIFVLLCHVGLLLFDGFPWLLISAGVLCHLCYASLLSTFPNISLMSLGFIGGTIFLVASHVLAFRYFSEEWYTFQEVVAFFFVCEWVVPFSLFISLSANDLVLPTLQTSSGAGGGDGMERRQRRSGFLALVDILSQKISNITPSRTSKRY
ncbi:PREDICTED: protein TEX261-like [Amphimedon queenslandica]|uniref:Protein TEX261 n=1 Tax=Amphimedon queenslandica TaxID=400682 RepID=A0A1X7VP79_AMPQE|nr:PREDICTED: protein TEX261-like [Amphimedon queenslandica]|eukprot:XP_019861396.1 PREDICTED: protein TEX261-like [Amphimedon queenslandica]